MQKKPKGKPKPDLHPIPNTIDYSKYFPRAWTWEISSLATDPLIPPMRPECARSQVSNSCRCDAEFLIEDFLCDAAKRGRLTVFEYDSVNEHYFVDALEAWKLLENHLEELNTRLEDDEETLVYFRQKEFATEHSAREKVAKNRMDFAQRILANYFNDQKPRHIPIAHEIIEQQKRRGVRWERVVHNEEMALNQGTLLSEPARPVCLGRVSIPQEVRKLIQSDNEPNFHKQLKPENTIREYPKKYVITFEGEEIRVRKTKGWTYIVQLILKNSSGSNDGIPSVELYGLLNLPATNSSFDSRSTGFGQGECDLPHSDDMAKIEKQIRTLTEKANEERDFGNHQLADQHFADAKALAKEYRRPGKMKSKITRGPNGKAANSVQNAIKRALDSVKDDNPALHNHLSECIKTGAKANYVPQPVITWEVSR